MQRRLATHAHYAVRGTIPRALMKEVAAATYHQVWWPKFDTMVYTTDRPPVWDEAEQSYVDPKTRQPLTHWDDALDALNDPDAEPAHVARLGSIDVKGIEGGTEHAERAIKYATKYITKDLVDQTIVKSAAQKAHAERLYEALSTLPCSPRCANWLLYGVQPDKPKPGLTPGRCRGKVHQRKTLGYTGRRCLVSRNWSGKTRTDHRLDGRDWFRAIVGGELDHTEEGDSPHQEGWAPKRYIHVLARDGDRDVDPSPIASSEPSRPNSAPASPCAPPWIDPQMFRQRQLWRGPRNPTKEIATVSSSTLDRFRPKPTRDRLVYTVQEVAHMLGIALSGTYTLIREGTIPAMKVGARWVVPKARFHAWLDGIEDQADELHPPDGVPASRGDTGRSGERWQ